MTTLFLLYEINLFNTCSKSKQNHSTWRQQFLSEMTDNRTQLLTEIQSYVILLGITSKQNEKIISIFHLHLDGSARMWFKGLSDYDTWANLLHTFENKYMQFSAPKHMIKT